MAVNMRLTRVGGKKDPQWRVVVADRRSPRDGRFIEFGANDGLVFDGGGYVSQNGKMLHDAPRFTEGYTTESVDFGAELAPSARRFAVAETLSRPIR